jgi:hypothetical protein
MKILRLVFLSFFLFVAFQSCKEKKTDHERDLTSLFDSPPMSARPSAYWWWFNNLVTKESITHDLEDFKDKGFGGVMIVCTSNGYGVDPMPFGPDYLSPEWMELYKHALTEAGRLSLEVGVNLCGGWCMGGPWITKDNACRWFLQSEMTVKGPKKLNLTLPLPGPKDGYDSPPEGNVPLYINLPLSRVDYRDASIVAFRQYEGKNSKFSSDQKQTLSAKSNRIDSDCFIPAVNAMGQTLTPLKDQPGDNPIAPSDVVDLTANLKPDGSIEWDVPEGTWTLIRTGHRMTGQRVNMSMPQGNARNMEEILYRSDNPAAGSSDGWAVDWFSIAATEQHFKNLGEKLIEGAGQFAGKTLKYFGTDSFEDGYPNWTAKLREEFMKYRSYDPAPYFPVFKGYIIGSAEISDRFLHDYRKTIADCMADNNYGRLAELSHEHGLGIQCEAAGPSWSGTVCMDALKNLGRCDYPQGEFWQDGIFVMNGQNKVAKQTASASHIYGKKTASAESFTSFLHWRESPADLKPTADRAFCEGINRFLFHTVTAQRPEDGSPGYEYGAGTHFNPNITWWNQSAKSWVTYLSRCQTLLQSGLFVADVLYYNGDWAPNLVDVKHNDPSLGKGYDYDVCNEEVLLNRLSVREGRIVLPDGMSYRLLVLPESKCMPAEVINKIRELVEAGATVVGPKPDKDPGLRNYPLCDVEVRKTASYLWGEDNNSVIDRKTGKGRIIYGRTLRDVLLSDGVNPDFEYTSSDTSTFIDFIHRTTPEAEIYFLANRRSRVEPVNAVFRVNGRKPELWDAVTGERRALPEFEIKDGRTSVNLEFDPSGSVFIIFPEKPSKGLTKRTNNFPDLKPVFELSGPWDVQFDRKWFYPVEGLTGKEAEGKFTFGRLEDWSNRQEDPIKHFSGTALYRKVFEVADPALKGNKEIFLDLGKVYKTARVRLNGRDLGVLWCQPWHVNVSGVLKDGENIIEVEVVNLWPNRLIGDDSLPEEERRTRTNVISYRKDSPLMPSGLLGPVILKLASNE